MTVVDKIAPVENWTRLPWRNIVHDKRRTTVSIAAVAFAISIMFMELGFLNGLYDSQTAAVGFLRADLIMVSRAWHALTSRETFPRSRLEQLREIEAIKAVSPIYIEDKFSLFRNSLTGTRNNIRVIAFDPDDNIFQDDKMNVLCRALHQPLSVLFDWRSRRFFGPVRAGTRTELASRAVNVAGTFDLGSDYRYDGNILVSTDTLLQLFPNQSRDAVFLGLIQLKPGYSAAETLRRINDRIGSDVQVLTKDELIDREKAIWQKTTAAGYIFEMGVAVGFVIGVFIIYQILYIEISDHLPQLATLKAIGNGNGYLIWLVLAQAALLTIFAFIPAVAITAVLYALLTAITGVGTKLTVLRVGLVLLLTSCMCIAAGLFAVRRVIMLDPAELF
jgi:putative ABC transport system permease protein